MRNSQVLNISLLNAQSVGNKTGTIRDYISDYDIDILCLTETWLSSNDTAVIAELVPETHIMHHSPRDGRGGGVGVIVSRKIEGVKSKPLKFQHFECLELSINHKNKLLIIYIIYRPPSSPRPVFISEFESFLIQSEVSDKNVIYMGDFNLWMNDLNDGDARRFTEILHNFDLINHVNAPTYDSGRILDLIITKNCSNLLGDIEVEPACTISDHRLITSTLNLRKVPKLVKTIFFRNKSNINSNDFAQILRSIQPSENVNCNHFVNIPICADCLISIYKRATSEYFERSAPLIEKNISICDSNNRWYNTDIKTAKRTMRKAEKLFLKYKTDFYKDEFKRLRQIKCDLVTNSKKSFYKTKIEGCGNDNNKLFGILDGLLGKESSYVLPQCHSEILLANKFKDFFLKKIEDISSNFELSFVERPFSLIPDFPLNPFDSFAPISLADMMTLIRKSKKTFCDNDPFDLRLFEFDEICEPLAQYFCGIVNHSFDSGLFPVSEKFAVVRPLIKGKNDPDQLASYRPLYNTSFLSKVLESAALSQLLTHLNNFESFPKVQSAYRKFHSVETAMCKIYNDLIIRKYSGECTILVLLDLSAAFDTIDHDLLKKDLKILGLGGKALSWFESYLENREFCVNIGRQFSDRARMRTGIPQGSVLGPVLFIIYTIELYYLLQSINVDCHFYADDTQLYFSVEDSQGGQERLNEVYAAVENWMISRKLKLNSGKTEIMLIGSPCKIRLLSNFKEMIVGNSVVTLADQVRSLGVILDQTLTLKKQLNNTKRKVIYNLINISRISKYINEASRMKLVHCLVFSVLDFCNSLYYGLPNHDLHSFQILINSAARIVIGMPQFSRDRITPVCITLHFLPFKARIIYKICLLTYKAVKYGQPRYLANLLKKQVPATNMDLRNYSPDRLDEPMISRSVGINRCFSYSAPRLYNALPEGVRNSDDVGVFKKRLKTHLFTEAYDLSSQTINPEFIL